MNLIKKTDQQEQAKGNVQIVDEGLDVSQPGVPNPILDLMQENAGRLHA